MTKQIKIIFTLLFFILLARLFAMVTIPLTDTTEARYAHTAYLMATSNDWITPYFDVNIPFWGKPPFSFWMEALSYKLFGFHDFSPRLPALLFTLMTILLIVRYLKTFYTYTTAWWGALIYATFLLTYALSGAVLTDPYLVFSTTLTMVSFIMIMRKQENYWHYLFFIGISIGLLAKGPLALVLIGGAMVFWILFDFKNRVAALKNLYWLRGTLLMLLLVLPWYIIAEMKTPGFLNYFIVGEHFKRFVDSGWKGDLYGASHKKAHGIIWLMWVQASFPWVFLVFYALVKKIHSKNDFVNMLSILTKNSEISYFVMWSLFTMVFFSLAGNTLWTYILPSLPALAILLAIYLEKVNFDLRVKNVNLLYPLAMTVPFLLLVTNLVLIVKPDLLPTEKFMISYYQSVSKPDAELYYMYERPFSAQYYSDDQAILISNSERKRSKMVTFKAFEKRRLQKTKQTFVAIPRHLYALVKKNMSLDLKKRYESKKYFLFELVSH